ncbi:MAG: hypothetical protein GX051_04990 [Clostridiales bacterium]|nr:hypothetical protein [Clostridiales bacterium]
MNNMYKCVEDMAKSALLCEVLRRFDKYGIAPYTLEKELDTKVCGKTLYNYINGDTKPRASVYNPVLAEIKSKYSKLYDFVIDEIIEEYGALNFSNVIKEMEREGAPIK